MFCPQLLARIRWESGLVPGMWARGEAEGRRAGRSLAVKIKEGDLPFQWDLQEDAMNLDVQ